MLNESLKNLSSFHKDILKRLVRFLRCMQISFKDNINFFGLNIIIFQTSVKIPKIHYKSLRKFEFLSLKVNNVTSLYSKPSYHTKL